MVPSCPVVNLQYGTSMAEVALRKGLPRCDSMFDSAYERFEASLAIKPLVPTYETYAQVRGRGIRVGCSCLLTLVHRSLAVSMQMLRNHAGIKKAHGQLDEAQQLEQRADQIIAAQLADDRLVES